MLYKIDNIHNERETCYTDSTLPGYSIMSVVCILYVYQDSALNHMGGQVDGKSLDSRLVISEENNRSVVDDKQKTKCDSFEGRQHLYVATGSNRYGHTQIHNSDQ